MALKVNTSKISKVFFKPFFKVDLLVFSDF